MSKRAGHGPNRTAVEHGDARLRLPVMPRGVLVDASLALAVLVVVAAAIAADVGGERQPDAFAYLFAGGLGALMFVRRSFPVLALVATSVGICAYYTAGYPPIGLAVPAAAALYSTAEAGKLRWAACTAAGLFAVASFFQIREGVALDFYFGFQMASTVGLMAAVIAVGDGVRARRLWHAEQRLREQQSAVEREQEAARRVQEERMRIARDLHDVLAHNVSVISLHSDVAAEALADDTAAARTALRNVQTASGDAMRELRNTVTLLREQADGEQRHPVGRLDELGALAGAISAGGLAVEVRIEGEPATLPVAVDTTVYRIVQESLTNALRHARAGHAGVVVTYTPDTLRIRITDDGEGADSGCVDGGHGIAGMRERAALLGGTLRAGNREPHGFQVEASLPLGES